jgi:hypothetical protein
VVVVVVVVVGVVVSVVVVVVILVVGVVLVVVVADDVVVVADGVVVVDGVVVFVAVSAQAPIPKERIIIKNITWIFFINSPLFPWDDISLYQKIPRIDIP